MDIDVQLERLATRLLLVEDAAIGHHPQTAKQYQVGQWSGFGSVHHEWAFGRDGQCATGRAELALGHLLDNLNGLGRTLD